VPTQISITGGGSYSINGLPRTTAVGTVVNGDIVDVQMQSSTSFGTVAVTTLTVGGYSAGYSIETLAADTHPDAFAFVPVFGAAPSTRQSSNEITIAGINTSTPISVIGGTYQIDGGPWIFGDGSIQPGSRIRVATVTTAAEMSEASVTIGDVSARFQALTVIGDATPQAFSFTSANGFPLLGQISEPMTISGLSGAARIEITGGQFSLDGGPFTSSTGIAHNGNVLRLLLTAGPMLNDVRMATVTVGGFVTTWTLTTSAPEDRLTDYLRFPDSRAAPVNSDVVTPPMPINGINVPVPISINAPYTYSLNGGAFTGAPGTARAGDILQLKVTTGPEYGRAYSLDITIGNGTINWPVKTVSSPTRPNRFTLSSASASAGALVLPGSVQFTDPVVVTNSAGPTAVLVTGGQYSVNGGPYSSAAGTVAEGDRIVVRFVMPQTFATSFAVNLRLANVSSSLTVTTTVDPVANTPATVAGSAANYVLRSDAVIPLRAFVFNPTDWQPSDRRAVYIDWSGGGWARGGLPGTRSRYWATDQGMVVISPDQRVNDRFGTYAYVHADDARLVVRWAQENAAQLGIDPTRIVVTGTSSGGGNAVWASLLEPPVTTSYRNNPLFRVGAVVLRSGVSSTAPDAQLAQSQLDRFGKFVDDISPERGIDGQLSPYLIFHADGDVVFAETANLRLCTTIRSLGRVCDFINEPGLGHDWPSAPGKTDESRAQELEFLQRIGILPSVR
ncbi:alpha/beta hydrolase, partial [uncultured Nevskia sp.]|uniref:alpha/beta hydrolase n=1 Tax=uncultured Nevskia sp. TaxID=228950 RepID=UPI0025FDD694